MNTTNLHVNLHNSSQGSVLVIILIAVSLFGALSYTVANMLRSDGGVNALSDQQAGIIADEVLDYARSVRLAVRDLQISNGCSDEQISFENSIVGGYVNPNAPTDLSCHVFEDSGGGLDLQPASNNNIYQFSASRFIFDVGTTGSNPSSRAELYLALNVNSALCMAINDKLDVANPSNNPPRITSTGVFFKFTGSYAGGNSINNASLPSGLAATRGKLNFCAEQDDGAYYLVSVLIAR